MNIPLILLLAWQAPSGARHAFDDAKREYNVGRFERAAELFEDAYRLSGDPIMLFDLGQARRQAGESQKAVAAYKAFLRERPDASNHAYVENKIRELEAGKHKGIGASAISDSDLVDPLPTISATQRPVANGLSTDAITSSSSTPPTTHSYKRTWIAGGATAALLASTVVAGLAAESLHSDLASGCGQAIGGCSVPQVQDLRKRAMVTNVLGGLTIGAGAITGLMFFLDAESVGVGGRF